ncbi:MAG TPA: hypothetical protein VNP92_22590 [Actinophytocola sp.]|nr:hypothetical protein [Actinophytocola sp.]
MRLFLVIVQAILVVAGLGLGGFAGYRAVNLIGDNDAAVDLQSYLVLAVVALVLIAAAGVVRPRNGIGIGQPLPPAPQRRPPMQQQHQPYPPGGGYRGGPQTGPQPPVLGGGGPHTGSQPPIRGEQPYPGGQ